MNIFDRAPFMANAFPMEGLPHMPPQLSKGWNAILDASAHLSPEHQENLLQELFERGRETHHVSTQWTYPMHAIGIIFGPDCLASAWLARLSQSEDSLFIAKTAGFCLHHNKASAAKTLLSSLTQIKSTYRLSSETQEEILFGILHKQPDPSDIECFTLLERTGFTFSHEYESGGRREPRGVGALDGCIKSDNLPLFLHLQNRVDTNPRNTLLIALSCGALDILNYAIRQDAATQKVLIDQPQKFASLVCDQIKARPLIENERIQSSESRCSDEKILAVFDLLLNHAPRDFSEALRASLENVCHNMEDAPFQGVIQKSLLLPVVNPTLQPPHHKPRPRL